MNNVLKEHFQKYAIIIPCYNEENNFPYHHFLSFAKMNPNVLLCFVNDGSYDGTASLLRGIQLQSPECIEVLSLKQQVGKSEAVRQGMLYIHAKYPVQLLGFLDVNLTTTPEEWLQMAIYKENNPNFGAIVCSRIQHLGVEINRDSPKSLLRSMARRVIKSMLKTNLQYAQHGVKIFDRDWVPFLFAEAFQTSMLFDVEIFLRLKKRLGHSTLQKEVLEFPLIHWTEIKLKKSVKIPFELLRLYCRYRIVSFPERSALMTKKVA